MRSIFAKVFPFLVRAGDEVVVNGTGHSGHSMAQNFMGNWVDKLVSSLFDRTTAILTHHHANMDMDEATLAKGSGGARTLSDKSIGDGKYILCPSPQRSSSGKSQIYRGYLTNNRGKPTGEELAIKISPNVITMARENANYDKVASGIFSGRFVKKIEFLPGLNNFVSSGFDEQCALVMECGQKDLRDVMYERRGRGLERKDLRKAAQAAAECIQAMHSSGLVWTDLKAQNFVVVGKNSRGVKGIDIESAVPHRSQPAGYSPEACPPEFARAVIAKREKSFKLEYSYDIWSYGMYLYELAVGEPYFEGSPDQINRRLAKKEFQVDLRPVEDVQLRNLIEQCLRNDPKKRPNIVQILVHPYLVGLPFR